MSTGMCKALGLSGRPARPFGLNGTAKFYRVFGSYVLCFPLLYEEGDYYLSQDLTTVIQNVKVHLFPYWLIFRNTYAFL